MPVKFLISWRYRRQFEVHDEKVSRCRENFRSPEPDPTPSGPPSIRSSRRSRVPSGTPVRIVRSEILPVKPRSPPSGSRSPILCDRSSGTVAGRRRCSVSATRRSAARLRKQASIAR